MSRMAALDSLPLKHPQNILQSGDTQAHNSLPSIFAVEGYLFPSLFEYSRVPVWGAVFMSALCFSSISFPMRSWL